LLFERMDHTHRVTEDRFRIVRCSDCGFVFVNPRPSKDDIHAFYPPEFYDVDIDADMLIKSKETVLREKAKFLDELTPGRLLDIGCQKGEFLYWMKRKGWDVEGVEFSSLPPNLFDVPIHRREADSLGFEDHSFDVITLWAVLEHVHDPVAVLREVRRLLRPSGRAVVLIPNFNSIPGRYMRHDDVPRHLLMFTPKTFGTAAGAAGLVVRRLVFSDDVFSGSTRGFLNFVAKRALGESFDEILAQNRAPSRWDEFTSTARGRPSKLVQRFDRWDLRHHPRLDRLMCRLRLSFIMTAVLEPRRGRT
jgi:SAM-dependent methyltransferase